MYRVVQCVGYNIWSRKTTWKERIVTVGILASRRIYTTSLKSSVPTIFCGVLFLFERVFSFLPRHTPRVWVHWHIRRLPPPPVLLFDKSFPFRLVFVHTFTLLQQLNSTLLFRNIKARFGNCISVTRASRVDVEYSGVHRRDLIPS